LEEPEEERLLAVLFKEMQRLAESAEQVVAEVFRRREQEEELLLTLDLFSTLEDLGVLLSSVEEAVLLKIMLEQRANPMEVAQPVPIVESVQELELDKLDFLELL
jgi:hypothetical protein